MEHAKKELKLTFLELNWEDSISYVIEEDDLVQCARFIHQARTNGGSVLVHCAQVCLIISNIVCSQVYIGLNISRNDKSN